MPLLVLPSFLLVCLMCNVMSLCVCVCVVRVCVCERGTGLSKEPCEEDVPLRVSFVTPKVTATLFLFGPFGETKQQSRAASLCDTFSLLFFRCRGRGKGRRRDTDRTNVNPVGKKLRRKHPSLSLSFLKGGSLL